MATGISLCLIIMATWAIIGADLSGQSCTGILFQRDPVLCNVYYRCVHGRFLRMPECHDFMTFSMIHFTCVLRGTAYDDCEITSYTTDQLHAICDSNLTSVFADPANCHQFYNCSLNAVHTGPHIFATYVQECPYPQLFSAEHSRCMDYKHVYCYNRYEPKAPCDYSANSCPVAHCRPCSADQGSCVGLSDGINVWPGREWSPFYLECADERTIRSTRCPPPAHIYSPDAQSCVDIFHVPKEHGGLQPSCVEVEDGMYPDEEGRCPFYYKCFNNVFVDFYKCPDGLNFDYRTSLCQHPLNVCAPCGAEICDEEK